VAKGGGDPRSRPVRFVEGLRRRFLLRGYMTWIILATSASGVAMNAVLFHFGMVELWLRTLPTIAPCYFVFLLLVRLWIAIFDGLRRRNVVDAVDVLDGTWVVDVHSGASAESFVGSGGRFAGAGASQT